MTTFGFFVKQKSSTVELPLTFHTSLAATAPAAPAAPTPGSIAPAIVRPTRRGPSPSARRAQKNPLTKERRDELVAGFVEAAKAQELMDVPDKLRAGIPFGFARSKLFGVHERSKDYYRKTEILADDPVLGIQIAYRGPRLNQTHARLWQALVHISVTTGAASPQFVTTRPEVLRAMGVADVSTTSREWLDELLKDLGQAQVSVKTKRVHWWGQLVCGVGEMQASGAFSISFNPKMALLFADETVDIYLERKSSYRHQLAMWLHDYLASQHNDPKRQHPIEVERLHELCGSTDSIRDFRRNLRKAADLLVTKGSAPLLRSWSIEGDVFSYVKEPTHVTLIPKQAQAHAAGGSFQERAAQQARERRTQVAL